MVKLSYQNLALDSYGQQLLFAGTRFMLAGLMVLPFCRRSVVRSVCGAPKGWLLLVVLGQTYLQYLFFYYAMGVSSGTLGALLVGSGSLWWVLLAPMMLGSSPPKAKQWLVLAGCLCGIVLAVYAPGAGNGNVALGATCFLLASLSGAVGAIALKQVSREFGSRATTSVSLFFGGLLLMASGAFEWDVFWSRYSGYTLAVTIYLAFLSATAFTLWNRLIERYSVNVLSAFRFLIPLCGVVESALFIKSETVGMGIIVGGCLVIGSLIAMSRLEDLKE